MASTKNKKGEEDDKELSDQANKHLRLAVTSAFNKGEIRGTAQLLMANGVDHLDLLGALKFDPQIASCNEKSFNMKLVELYLQVLENPMRDYKRDLTYLGILTDGLGKLHFSSEFVLERAFKVCDRFLAKYRGDADMETQIFDLLNELCAPALSSDENEIPDRLILNLFEILQPKTEGNSLSVFTELCTRCLLANSYSFSVIMQHHSAIFPHDKTYHPSKIMVRRAQSLLSEEAHVDKHALAIALIGRSLRAAWEMRDDLASSIDSSLVASRAMEILGFLSTDHSIKPIHLGINASDSDVFAKALTIIWRVMDNVLTTMLLNGLVRVVSQITRHTLIVVELLNSPRLCTQLILEGSLASAFERHRRLKDRYLCCHLQVYAQLLLNGDCDAWRSRQETLQCFLHSTEWLAPLIDTAINEQQSIDEGLEVPDSVLLPPGWENRGLIFKSLAAFAAGLVWVCPEDTLSWSHTDLVRLAGLVGLSFCNASSRQAGLALGSQMSFHPSLRPYLINYCPTLDDTFEDLSRMFVDAESGESIHDALIILANLTKMRESSNALWYGPGAVLVASVLSLGPTDVEAYGQGTDLVELALCAVINLTSKKPGGKYAANRYHIATQIIKILTTHAITSARLAELSLWAIYNMCEDYKPSQEEFGQYIGAKAICNVMRLHRNDERVSARGCRAIYSICRVLRSNRKFFVGGKLDAVGAIRECSANQTMKNDLIRMLT